MAVDIEALSRRIGMLISDNGPMLGKELHAHLPEVGHLELWQACFSSDDLQISQFSRYYLRYDITREDMIRLSPSILRDFMSFTLMSISQGDLKGHRACAFIAGDLAYFLGHNEPREVAALGELVRGSDLDVIIVHDGLEPADIEKMEAHMLAAKNYLMRKPSLRQELDFIIKPVEKMFGQFRYHTIQEKIASKIVYESLFMAGSVVLYTQIMDQLRLSGTEQKITDDFSKGLEDRSQAVTRLLGADQEDIDVNVRSLFYFSQERLEFE